MAYENPSDVDAAFDILLEQIETEIDLVNRRGARAFESRDYETARVILERAGLYIAFRDRSVSLRREWASLANQKTGTEDEASEEQVERRNLGRVPSAATAATKLRSLIVATVRAVVRA